MTLDEKIKKLKTTKGKKWDELTREQKLLFEDEQLLKIMTVIYSDKCPFCKLKFSDVLYNHKWNTEILVHIKTTHGFDPETFIDLLTP